MTTTIGTGHEVAFGVLLQSDGKAVAGGFSNNGTSNKFALVRYNTDGSLDTSFNSSGKVTSSIGANEDTPQSIALATDGSIILAGRTSNGTNLLDFALVRYNTDGSLGGFGSMWKWVAGSTTINTTGSWGSLGLLRVAISLERDRPPPHG